MCWHTGVTGSVPVVLSKVSNLGLRGGNTAPFPHLGYVSVPGTPLMLKLLFLPLSVGQVISNYL